MCELAGVQVSYPMLHQDVLDVSTQVPADMKMRGTQLRSFYKEAMADFLPTEIINKSKHGLRVAVRALAAALTTAGNTHRRQPGQSAHAQDRAAGVPRQAANAARSGRRPLFRRADLEFCDARAVVRRAPGELVATLQANSICCSRYVRISRPANITGLVSHGSIRGIWKTSTAGPAPPHAVDTAALNPASRTILACTLL